MTGPAVHVYDGFIIYEATREELQETLTELDDRAVVDYLIKNPEFFIRNARAVEAIRAASGTRHRFVGRVAHGPRIVIIFMFWKRTWRC